MSHIFCGDCGYYSYQKTAPLFTSIKCSCGGIAYVLKSEHPFDNEPSTCESIDENIDESSVDEVSVTSEETMSPVPLRGEPPLLTTSENSGSILPNQQTDGSYIMIQLPFD